MWLKLKPSCDAHEGGFRATGLCKGRSRENPASKLSLKIKCQNFFMIIITASYGSIVRGSVFEIKYRVLGRVFESIETEFKVITKSLIVDIFQVKIKKMSNDKVLELNVVISRKNS